MQLALMSSLKIVKFNLNKYDFNKIILQGDYLMMKYLRLLACLTLAGWGTILNPTAVIASDEIIEASLSELSSDSTASIKATMGSDGEILTDQRGMSLYVYDADTSILSKCVGECIRIWKPFLRPINGITILGNVNSSWVGSLKRVDGGTQLLFNGKPLYFYTEDKIPGDTKGRGKVDAIGKWSLIKSDGTEVKISEQGQPPGATTQN
jgi:predicted lipoprotein with Yx(FWY)xxD motif